VEVFEKNLLAAGCSLRREARRVRDVGSVLWTRWRRVIQLDGPSRRRRRR